MTFIIRDRGKDKENDADEYIPTAEEAAEIEAGVAEIERGEWVDGDEFLRELRRRLAEE